MVKGLCSVPSRASKLDRLDSYREQRLRKRAAKERFPTKLAHIIAADSFVSEQKSAGIAVQARIGLQQMAAINAEKCRIVDRTES